MGTSTNTKMLLFAVLGACMLVSIWWWSLPKRLGPADKMLSHTNTSIALLKDYIRAERKMPSQFVVYLDPECKHMGIVVFDVLRPSILLYARTVRIDSFIQAGHEYHPSQIEACTDRFYFELLEGIVSLVDTVDVEMAVAEEHVVIVRRLGT